MQRICRGIRGGAIKRTGGGEPVFWEWQELCEGFERLVRKLGGSGCERVVVGVEEAVRGVLSRGV